MKAQFAILALVLVSVLSYAQAPVPFINLPLMPDATAPGGPQFTLTVNGTGFQSNSVVNWNGTPLATTFVSQSKLSSTVPAANIAIANTGWITVVTPPPGGGTSDAAFFTVTSPKGDAVGFGPATTTVTGPEPTAVAVGDFNGDGKLDVAVANWAGPLAVFLGDGTGKFTQAWSWSPSSPTRIASVAVGDFNGDGKMDLAATDLDSNTVSVLLGDGTGNFTLASSPAVGVLPDEIAVADFNRDGKLDLAVTNRGSDTVSILLGDGTGNFTLASSPSTGSVPGSVAVGDFNGDGNLDLVVANEYGGTVWVLLGDGTGNFTFASSLPYACYDWSSCLAVGDFNDDGILDLAVGGTSTSVLLGDGTGNFTLASTIAPNFDADSVKLGDFNADGKLDLALGSQNNSTLSIFLGDGTGNFTVASDPDLNIYPDWVGVALGDFNGDGHLDLAVADHYSSAVGIFLQGFPAATVSPTSLGFGAQLVGTSSQPQTVTLANNGGAVLKIKEIATSYTSFSQSNNCPNSLPVNGQCTISVTFGPLHRGPVNGALVIKDNAPNSPQKVPLSGVGTVVGLSPSSLDFGDQPVNTTSPPQQVTLTNHGREALNIFNIQIGGHNHGAFAQTNNCGTSVPAQGSCSINVTFTPKRKGANSATLYVKDDGGDGPQKVPLSGTGE